MILGLITVSIDGEINKAAFKSRWDTKKKGSNSGFNEEHEKTFTPMPFCYIPKGKSIDELEVMFRRHRLEDIQKRIAVGDFEINDPDLRSPSPESAYDPSTGQNINSREARAREKYTVEKNFLIEELLKLDNTFIAPADYKPPMKKRKIYLPDEDGDTNYIGLIIGPGGKTQKDLEKRSRCKIAIRGRGANIKSRIYNRKENDQNEPLHILVESQKEEDLEVGVRLVEELLDPNSDVKKNQLIEIAAIRGTLRDDWCEDCGEKGHRRFECPNKINSWKRVDLRCEICGQTTHPSRDCPMKRQGWEEGISVEDDLNEFLENLKSKKKALENGAENKDKVEKDNAFEDAAKKVVSEIEKEAPGTVPKEVKDKIKPYEKKDEKLNDRVVALIDDKSRQVALTGNSDDEEISLNPLKDLDKKHKDIYGKLLANEAVNFYNQYNQKNAYQAQTNAYPTPNGPPPTSQASSGPPPPPNTSTPSGPPPPPNSSVPPTTGQPPITHHAPYPGAPTMGHPPVHGQYPPVYPPAYPGHHPGAMGRPMYPPQYPPHQGAYPGYPGYPGYPPYGYPAGAYPPQPPYTAQGNKGNGATPPPPPNNQ